MNCQKCGSKNIISVTSKCSDRFHMTNLNGPEEKEGYVPYGLNIGGGDYVEIEFCTECGQLQGEWPVEVDWEK